MKTIIAVVAAVCVLVVPTLASAKGHMMMKHHKVHHMMMHHMMGHKMMMHGMKKGM